MGPCRHNMLYRRRSDRLYLVLSKSDRLLGHLISQSREAKPFTRHTIPESFLAITAFFAFSIQVTPA